MTGWLWDQPCRRRDDAGSRFADPARAGRCEPTQPTVVGVRVGADGRLHEVGRFVAEDRVRRVLPVGDRLAVVTRTSVIMLDPHLMRPLGSIDLDRR